MILRQHCFDRVWIADPNIRTNPVYDTAYTPADVVLDSLRYHKHRDRSHIDIIAYLYHMELAHVSSTESGGYRVLRHSRLVEAPLIIGSYRLINSLESWEPS